ncbi:probable amino acid permease 7 isoform X3 [Sesamum indicum]|uniref:Probable amino acid permease 7 isoform X3 n=1 Tax=Sesamum indicum TaxID=4182 RepID=A0A8M8V4J6_SESIN|nr:probable amino acid permease 7 isoform X3 [Sesamum indicum]
MFENIRIFLWISCSKYSYILVYSQLSFFFLHLKPYATSINRQNQTLRGSTSYVVTSSNRWRSLPYISSPFTVFHEKGAPMSYGIQAQKMQHNLKIFFFCIAWKKSAWVCGIIVRINFIKVGIVYTITSSISMRAIQRSNCYHSEGHTAACKYGTTYYMLTFGIIQVIVSQIPDFRNTEWLSVVAAVMSFTYSIIGSALGLAKVIENREIKGSIEGVPTSTAAQKVWSISQAIGDIAFAFPFSLIFLEIMDTLKSNPPEKVTMKKASVIAVCVTTFFYLSCGGLGYAAFGNSTPGNLLTGFGFYEPYWLVDFANACVVLHLIGGYQVFTQPLYASIEQWFTEKFPNNEYVHGDLKQMPALRLNLLRLGLRTAYVGFTTGFAMLFPYFNQVVGLAGAINFWPVVVYFPVEMYLVQKEIRPWTSKSIILRIYCFITLLVILFAFVGSIKGLIAARFS